MIKRMPERKNELLAAVLAEVEASEGFPLILCGDFNGDLHCYPQLEQALAEIRLFDVEQAPGMEGAGALSGTCRAHGVEKFVRRDYMFISPEMLPKLVRVVVPAEEVYDTHRPIRITLDMGRKVAPGVKLRVPKPVKHLWQQANQKRGLRSKQPWPRKLVLLRRSFASACGAGTLIKRGRDGARRLSVRGTKPCGKTICAAGLRWPRKGCLAANECGGARAACRRGSSAPGEA